MLFLPDRFSCLCIFLSFLFRSLLFLSLVVHYVFGILCFFFLSSVFFRHIEFVATGYRRNILGNGFLSVMILCRQGVSF